MSQWWHAWRWAVSLAWQDFKRTPLAWLASAGVVATAVALPVILHMAVTVLAPVARDIAADPEVSVYMKLDASDAEVRQARDRIQEILDAAQAGASGGRLVLRAVPKAEALAKFRALAERSGTGGGFDLLQNNPLPDGFVVRSTGMAATQLDALAQQLRAVPKVELVQFDAQWVQRLGAVLALASVLQWGAAGVFAAVVVAVTFNAVYVRVLAERDEIAIAGLVGATASTIRRPFMVRGALVAGLGACFALLLAGGARVGLSGLFDAEVMAPADTARLWFDAAFVVACVVLLGAAGGYWAAQRFLRLDPGAR